MDGQVLPHSQRELYARLVTAATPRHVDVRRLDAFTPDDLLIVSIFYRFPKNLPRQRCLDIGQVGNAQAPLFFIPQPHPWRGNALPFDARVLVRHAL